MIHLLPTVTAPQRTCSPNLGELPLYQLPNLLPSVHLLPTVMAPQSINSPAHRLPKIGQLPTLYQLPTVTAPQCTAPLNLAAPLHSPSAPHIIFQLPTVAAPQISVSVSARCVSSPQSISSPHCQSLSLSAPHSLYASLSVSSPQYRLPGYL